MTFLSRLIFFGLTALSNVVCLFIETRALSALRKDLKNTLRSAYSAGTYSNLRTQFKAFLLFCKYFSLTPMPADLDTLCLYVQFLSRTLSPPSIRNYLSGVRLAFILRG